VALARRACAKDTDVQQGEKPMRELITQRLAGESGQAVVEYGVLLALIVVGALAFIPGLAGAVTAMWQSAHDAILSVL
jgi:Flp pilus assembly pilin Flp